MVREEQVRVAVWEHDALVFCCRFVLDSVALYGMNS